MPPAGGRKSRRCSLPAAADLISDLGVASGCFPCEMPEPFPLLNQFVHLDSLMGFRASPVMRASVVKWAENQPDTPTLSEAIRRLVELGLKSKTKGCRE